MPRFSRGKLGLATWVAVAFVGALVPALAPVRGQTAVDEVIVYTTLQSYNLDVFLREADGRSWRRLTADQANDYNAVFSPDGAWVVFCSERRGNPDLFALNLDRGGPPRPLTSSHTMEDAPAFSPDGRSLAFVSDRHGNADIFVMPFAPDDPDGDRHAVNLTNLPGGDFNPVFSPDGTRIAFTSERHLPPTEPAYWQTPMELSGGEIYVMGVDGRDVSRLTRSPGWDGAPSWSEDGERIYFYSHRDSRSRIWQMGADGSNQRPVSPAELEGALWATPAPAGRIAFSAHGKLYSIAPDGEDPLEEAGTDTGLAAPVFHLPTGRLLAHGEGPIEGRILREDGRPFAASGTTHTVGLVDRTLRVEGIYPSFPAFGPTGHDVVSSQTIPGEFGRRAVVV